MISYSFIGEHVKVWAKFALVFWRKLGFCVKEDFG